MKEYTPPSSKSIAHRAMICASYCEEESLINNANLCDDVLATANALKSLGAEIKIDAKHKTIRVRRGVFPRKPAEEIYCMDSASTLRLMIAQTFSVGEFLIFNGSNSLAKRPLDSYLDFFDKYGISYQINPKSSYLPIKIKSKIGGGNYEISAEKSSQFASGLMLFLASKNTPSSIKLIGKTESMDYIRLTAEIMSHYGAEVEIRDNLIEISKASYHPKDILVEADFSQASYFIGLGLLHEGIIIKNLNMKSKQADRKIVGFIKKMGGDLRFEGNNLAIKKSKLKACHLDVSECPDLAPTLAGLLSLAEGQSIISGCKRLIYKESDRLHKTALELKKLGANIEVSGDSMIIDGVERLSGDMVHSYGDHRLVMMFYMLKPMIDGKIEVIGDKCVSKSYPDFFNDFGEYYE